MTEGIADYVRYERYEPGKQKWKLDPEKSSYKQGYGIAGAFLAVPILATIKVIADRTRSFQSLGELLTE